MSVAISDTVAHLEKLARQRAARGAARRAELERLLPMARDVLRSRGARAVYAFGSVATGKTTPSSDLDLATVGLPREVYFDALAELMRALPCEVDLVRLEEATEALRERIRAEGLKL